jgi:hypothetical protein
VFLFELRAIATRNHSPDSQLDPIFVFFGLFFRGRSSHRFAVGTRAKPSDGYGSRKSQHQESARRGFHNIQINI